ncbi:hypothetical protein RND71_039460 [Anisodus tanguticus]|uniref:Uncharacterized protein n=1 Tax=Anisodus tanguticus TaxID=243964 RepID=A0AAE1UXM0_9SOLA|nr:hypothetical protein RND71_039460 [Anisodus tanguticus]
MGSCISKCNPQKNPQEDDDHHHEYVKDKLVISQAPISPKISLPSSTIQQPRKLISSSSSSSCSVSLSSFSSTATNVTLSSSLSSSSSSSISSCFKDRSFSNEFLLSCAQENDHILDIKKNKGTNCVISHQNTSTMSTSGKKYARSPASSTLSKQPSPRRECNSSTPKKRPRENSPTMVRQKSFRKEPDQQLIKGGNIGNNNTSNITSTYPHFPSTRTTLKSPSPSRRFPSNNLNDESSFRKSIASKGNNGSVISRSSSLRRENHFTPKNEGKMRNALPVSPKIDEMEIGEVKSNNQDLDSFLMEDINNPLIALDCFIFL